MIRNYTIAPSSPLSLLANNFPQAVVFSFLFSFLSSSFLWQVFFTFSFFFSVLFVSLPSLSSSFISFLFYSIPFHSIPFHSILFYSILFYSILFYWIGIWCLTKVEQCCDLLNDCFTMFSFALYNVQYCFTELSLVPFRWTTFWTSFITFNTCAVNSSRTIWWSTYIDLCVMLAC